MSIVTQKIKQGKFSKEDIAWILTSLLEMNLPHIQSPKKLIDLSGLCPYAAGRNLFQETQGNMEQWERINVSLKAVGYTMDKTKLLLLIEEVMNQTVRIDRGCQPALNPEKTSKEQER